jgi:hypothetical protein
MLETVRCAASLVIIAAHDREFASCIARLGERDIARPVKVPVEVNTYDDAVNMLGSYPQHARFAREISNDF